MRSIALPASVRPTLSDAGGILRSFGSLRGACRVGLLDRWRSAPAGQPQHAHPSLVAAPGVLPPGWAVVDVETTGLSAGRDRILELAIVRTDTDLNIVDEWVCRFHPDGPVGAVHVHGITDADVARAPRFAVMIDDVTRRLAGAAIVGHNVNFDLAFLRAEFARAGWALPFLPALCTYEAASSTHLPHLARHRLGDCCAALNIPIAAAHSALGDARATYALFGGFMHPQWGVPPTTQDVQLPAQARAVVWPREPGGVRVTTGERRASRMDDLPDYVQRKIAQRAQQPTAPALRELLDQVRLADALDDGAPAGSMAYLELLAEALEDGVLTDTEQQALGDLANVYELDPEHVAAAHRGFVLALAHLALVDGKVTRAEKAELSMVSALLGVDAKVVNSQLKQAEAAREARLGADLRQLPGDWMHGEPLRVGDRVVFTGCEATERAHLEARAQELGVRLMSSVNGRTVMLVSDGSFTGGKADDAAALGTRVVSPAVFAALLAHLQPSLPRGERSPGASGTSAE